MRTAVAEFSVIDSRNESVGSVPGRTARPGRPAGRPADSRHPGGLRRPRGGIGYDRVAATLPVRGPHPIRTVEQARVGLATLAVTALITAAAVCGLIGLAHLRIAAAPAATQTVQVQPGESLSEVAQRVAPADPVRDTVSQIVDLNGLRGTEVVAGRTLLVPAPR
ncbi:LysM peptidoglycan-binding domain-containing protein [Nocardia spumae]|uniref:LysM peptidoglycan-binding domain-containing protein n=1 Tax=Nocardia spumae TaxID=2887190 RepID=UPI001D15D40E|nr:LysM peptidoglycan-binding domain-containing protein [Nocardia spumae]